METTIPFTQYGLNKSLPVVTSITVPVRLCAGLEVKELLNFRAFKEWEATLAHNLSLQVRNKKHTFHAFPYTLRYIAVQSVDRWPLLSTNGSIYFMKLIAILQNENKIFNPKTGKTESEMLPGEVFLRGASVAILVIFTPDDVDPSNDAEKYALMTVQARVASGSMGFSEIPAGMVDGDGSFSGAAARELYEETGMIIKINKLINMTENVIPKAESSREKLPRAMFPSVGGCDEFMPLFLYKESLPRAKMDEYRGKMTGMRADGERIKLKLVRLKDLWHEGARDGKTLAAWALYEGLRKTGKI